MRERFLKTKFLETKKLIKIDSKKAVQQDLRNAGISDPREWAEAVIEIPKPEKETGINLELSKYEKLLTYLGVNEIKLDNEKQKQFIETQDSLKRLELLQTMSLPDVVASIGNVTDRGAYLYLINRLEFYQKLIEGEATKIDQYNNEEIYIDNSDVTPQTVQNGLLRDIEFSAMLGTPELGIFKIVRKRLKESNTSSGHMPLVKGYHSGIHEGSIGHAYPFLRKLYEKAKREVGKEEQRSGKKTRNKSMEHRAIILASNWLEEAMNYNDPKRSQFSSYSGSLDEAIAWARLGEQVKKQLRGMRRKIQGTDLHNIERFVGKSGVNKYDIERTRLIGQIKFLIETADVAEKKEFTDKENKFDIQKQHKRLQQERERLLKHLEKTRAQLELANLPGYEKELQIQSILDRYESDFDKLTEDYEKELNRLQGRTPEQLLTDLEQRQILVNERHEKRKSLAQKALDLHFKINHDGGDYKSKPFKSLVDWINNAPFGTIKRCHKMMRQGASEEAIVRYALADIMCHTKGVTREDLGTIANLVKQVKEESVSRNVIQKLQKMIQISAMASKFRYEVPIIQIAEMADKNFYGMEKVLEFYDLQQLRTFMDKNFSLEYVAEAKRVTKKFGHDLSLEEISDMASHNIYGLEDAFNNFNLDTINELLKQDAVLPNAVVIYNNSKKFDYQISIEEIAKTSKEIGHSFLRALGMFPLEDIRTMEQNGVNLDQYFEIKDLLTERRLIADHEEIIFIESYLRQFNDCAYHLGMCIDKFDTNATSQLISKNIKLSYILEIVNMIENKIPEEKSEEVSGLVSLIGRDFWTQVIRNEKFSLKSCIWLNAKFSPFLIPILHDSVSIFGEEALTEDQYRIMKKLSSGQITPELASLGINKSGKEGVVQLREKIAAFRRQLLSCEIDTKLVQSNIILYGIVKTLVRFDQSSWRENREQKFNDVLNSYEANKNRIRTLPAFMTPSDIQRIDLVDRKQTFEFTEAFLTRYSYLNDQIKSAFELYKKSKNPFSGLVERSKPLVEKIIGDLEQKKLTISKPEAQKGIQMRIDSLKGLNLRSVLNFPETIRILSQFSELKDLLIQVVFIGSLRKNKAYHERVEQQIKNGKPGVDGISFMLDFIDHVTNKETFKKYFQDKQSYNAFKGIVDVKALEEELARIQNHKIIGNVSIQFVPTRNLLTEFSGDIADACWTGKYDSILRQYPNFSSVTFVQDPGGTNERYIGASLLIETVSDKGEKLLIIRGLNPLENTINRLAVSDFFEKFTAWVKQIAEKDGRKAAIVIDRASGLAGTNRPVLYQYMSKFKAQGEKVILSSRADTDFNGYNILNQCILL